jgi:hypothetical protein
MATSQGGGSLIRELSANSPDGTRLGQSSTDLVSFRGATPQVQPSGNAQAAVARGQQAGVIATYSSTQSPAAVAQGTTAEQTLTIQSGTGGQMLLATTDIVFVNKPTSQAGLGVGNVRVSSSNTLGITFDNIPAGGGNITPTGSEAYKVVALRGLGAYALSATLSPAAVAANTSVEQTFTVTGVRVGDLIQVNKPTAQAGLDIGGIRVVSNNVVGITFMNTTASPITPTAAESYNFVSLPGLDAVNNDVMYGFNVGTVGAITAGVVVSGGSTTLTGLKATDMVNGLFKPTPQATATNIATPIYGIPTADTLTLYFLGTGTGSTPTASEVYGVRTVRLNPVAPLLNYSQSLAPVSVAAATTAEQTFTVTGLIAGTPVWVNKPTCQPGLAITGVRVSGTNTLAINYCNLTSAAIVPTTETYTIGNFQVPAPGAGNCVYQCVAAVIHGLGGLANALRSAAVSDGLVAGA